MELICGKNNPTVRVHSHLTTTMCFFGRHVRTVTLVKMQPISDDILTTSKNFVAVAKCERTLSSEETIEIEEHNLVRIFVLTCIHILILFM